MFDRPTLDDIMDMPKEMRFGYLYGMSPEKMNEMQIRVLKSRQVLEGHFIDDPQVEENAVWNWLS